MQVIKWAIVVFVINLVFAKDPFYHHKNPPMKIEKNYQYLGYLKGSKDIYGFIRRSGGEVMRLKLGKNPGFGKIIKIDRERICMQKQKKIWCLLKTLQLKPWTLES